MHKTISPKSHKISANIKVASDKSISHRSIIFGSIAEGKTEISNFLSSEDCICTKKAFKALGVNIELKSASELIIHGQGIKPLKAPNEDIYLGNSGTSIRLLSGLFSAMPFKSTLTGDKFLSKRPMQRIIKPLKEMGADISGLDDNYAPLKINHNRIPELKAINYESKIASAQVKSCLLFAAMSAEGTTTITEPHLSRNHTELMLKAFGADIKTKLDGSKASVSIKKLENNLVAQKILVPGDISSAAFFITAAAIMPEAEITIQDLGINPSRSGIIDVLREMNIDFDINNERTIAGEDMADITIRSSTIKATEIGSALIPRLIDEIPIIAVLAAQADGTTTIKDAEELRVKESDRIKTTVSLLQKLGVTVTETKDGMIIDGRAGKEFEIADDTIDSHGDHRIAMSAAIAALKSNKALNILQTEYVQTSFPNFFELLESL